MRTKEALGLVGVTCNQNGTFAIESFVQECTGRKSVIFLLEAVNLGIFEIGLWRQLDKPNGRSDKIANGFFGLSLQKGHTVVQSSPEDALIGRNKPAFLEPNDGKDLGHIDKARNEAAGSIGHHVHK